MKILELQSIQLLSSLKQYNLFYQNFILLQKSTILTILYLLLYDELQIIKLLNIIILYVDEKLNKYDIKLRYKKIFGCI